MEDDPRVESPLTAPAGAAEDPMTREKSETIAFRVKPEMRAAFERAAQKSGHTLADWIRAVLHSAANEGAFALRARASARRRTKRE